MMLSYWLMKFTYRYGLEIVFEMIQTDCKISVLVI